MKVFLGPLGELRSVPCFPSVSVEATRPVSFFTGLDGSSTAFYGAGFSRVWDWSVPLHEASAVSWLSELASGGVIGPYYLYTSSAAGENLLPSRVQSCAGFGGVVRGRRVVGSADGPVTVRVPVRPNTSYTLSALGDGSGSVSYELGGSPSVVGFGAGGFGAGGFGG